MAGSASVTRPYIAASSYLNAAPLCYSFTVGLQKDLCTFLSDAAPSRCAELLASGQADAALIPVIEYQRIDGLKVAAGACVASKATVRSVVLASKVPIHQVKSVALDSSSRTSAALIQIILSRFHGIEAAYETFAPDLDVMLKHRDAALMIGDPAMLIDRTGLYVYDLAEEWRRHTALPFVFAFWAVRSSSSAWPGGVDFISAKREGIEHIAEIAEHYSEMLGLPQSDVLDYLTQNISYELDEESLRGLRLYYDLARDCGLIDQHRKLVFADGREQI